MLRIVLSKKKLVSLSIASALAVSTVMIAPYSSSAAPDGLTAAQLTAMLKESEKKNGSSAIARVIGTGPNVTVMAQTQKTASDKDLKIDAVFYAKKLIESVSGQIERVDVIFSAGGTGDGKYISIGNKTISDYGSGKMSAEEFLSTLHFSPVTPDDLPSVEAGPQKERRLLILERIETLRKAGTGVKPFQTIFQSIESAIKSGDTKELSTKLSDIESRLSEQEEQVAIARKTASGRGVTHLESKSWSPSPPDTVNPNKSGNVLEEFQRMRANFINGGASKAIEKIALKNTAEAAKLRELKQQIDTKLSSNKSEEAFPLMTAFINRVESNLGQQKNRDSDGQQNGGNGQQNKKPFLRQGNNWGNNNNRNFADFRGRRMNGEK